MKSRLFLLSLFAAVWVCGCKTPSSSTSGNASPKAGIQTLSGALTLGKYKDHMIAVKANQLLTVNMDAYSTDCNFSIISPEGKIIYSGYKAGDNFSVTLNKEGTYRIRVSLFGTGSDTQRVNYTVSYTLQ